MLLQYWMFHSYCVLLGGGGQSRHCFFLLLIITDTIVLSDCSWPSLQSIWLKLLLFIYCCSVVCNVYYAIHKSKLKILIIKKNIWEIQLEGFGPIFLYFKNDVTVIEPFKNKTILRFSLGCSLWNEIFLIKTISRKSNNHWSRCRILLFEAHLSPVIEDDLLHQIYSWTGAARFLKTSFQFECVARCWHFVFCFLSILILI